MPCCCCCCCCCNDAGWAGCVLPVKWLAMVKEVLSLFSFLPFWVVTLDVEKLDEVNDELFDWLFWLVLLLDEEVVEEHDEEDEADDGLHMVDRGGDKGG